MVCKVVCIGSWQPLGQGLRFRRMDWPRHDTPLRPWLARTASLRPFSYYTKTGPDLEMGGFIGIRKKLALHKAPAIPAQDLATAWTKTKEYVEQAMALLSMPDGGTLDSDEVEMIREELGDPPVMCCPIYMITVRDEADERLVYVGKNSASSSRFAGGHAAITKLHAPRYRNKSKWIYLAQVMLLTADDYLPLEWVHPLDRALGILASVEAELIFSLKPELNTQKKNRSYVTDSFQIHIQNLIPDSKFLESKFVGPSYHHRDEPVIKKRRRK